MKEQKYTNEHIDLVVSRLNEYDDLMTGKIKEMPNCEVCYSFNKPYDCDRCLFEDCVSYGFKTYWTRYDARKNPDDFTNYWLNEHIQDLIKRMNVLLAKAKSKYYIKRNPLKLNEYIKE